MVTVCFDRPAVTWIHFEKELHSIGSPCFFKRWWMKEMKKKMIAVSQDLLFLKIKENKCFDTCIKKDPPLFSNHHICLVYDYRIFWKHLMVLTQTIRIDYCFKTFLFVYFNILQSLMYKLRLFWMLKPWTSKRDSNILK